MLCKGNGIDVMRYIDGEMDTQERDVFKEHLESCNICRDMVRELFSIKQMDL